MIDDLKKIWEFVDGIRIDFVGDDIPQAVLTQVKRTVLFNKQPKQLCIEQIFNEIWVNLTHGKQQMWAYTNNSSNSRLSSWKSQ